MRGGWSDDPRRLRARRPQPAVLFDSMHRQSSKTYNTNVRLHLRGTYYL